MPESRIAPPIALVFMLASVLLTANAAAEPSSLSGDDQKAIKATIEAYQVAWLKNDADGVLKTLTDDAVLLPAHGAPPVIGLAAIRSYWFKAGGPHTTVTRLDITVEQIDGNSGVAFVRGADNVAWTTTTQDGSVRHQSHPGTYLNVVKKRPDGSWRIQAHMWDDGPETTD